MKLIWILPVISALIIYGIYLYFVKKSNYQLERWEKENLNLDDIGKSNQPYPKSFAGIKSSNLPMFIFYIW